MKTIGIRVELTVAQWPENLKAARAGNYQVWSLGLLAAGADSGASFQRYDGKQVGGQNMSRVKIAALDALCDRIDRLPDGPERDAALKDAERLALAYMPYKYTLNRVSLDMTQKRVIGYRRPVFWNDWWHYVDIEGEGDKLARA